MDNTFLEKNNEVMEAACVGGCTPFSVYFAGMYYLVIPVSRLAAGTGLNGIAAIY